MAKLNSIKIYPDGTMVTITTELNALVASEPFGNVRLRPFGTTGLSFIRVSTNESIAAVDDFANIRDEAGTAYSATYLGTINALNVFLDKCCPSGGGSGDMLASIYDPSNLQLDVYNKANETGIEQITGNIITPPSLTVTTNDYNPTGFATANMIRLDVDANGRQLTGLLAPAAGVNRIVFINNINAGSLDLRLIHNSALSAASNRILLRDGGGRSVKPNQTAALWYDHTSQRWRSLNRVQ